MISKIAHAIKEAISPAKPPKSSIEYFDQSPPRIMHSSLEADRAQQADGWVNGFGRYRTNTWFNRR
jgi:hypothetical protein